MRNISSVQYSVASKISLQLVVKDNPPVAYDSGMIWLCPFSQRQCTGPIKQRLYHICSPAHLCHCTVTPSFVSTGIKWRKAAQRGRCLCCHTRHSNMFGKSRLLDFQQWTQTVVIPEMWGNVERKQLCRVLGAARWAHLASHCRKRLWRHIVHFRNLLIVWSRT